MVSVLKQKKEKTLIKHSTLELLKTVRYNLSNVDKWTQGHDAEDEFGGELVDVDDPAVVSRCVLGEMAYVCQVNYIPQTHEIAEKASEILYRHACGIDSLPSGRTADKSFIADFNDEHSHAEVLALLDEAIAEESTHNT